MAVQCKKKNWAKKAPIDCCVEAVEVLLRGTSLFLTPNILSSVCFTECGNGKDTVHAGHTCGSEFWKNRWRVKDEVGVDSSIGRQIRTAQLKKGQRGGTSLVATHTLLVFFLLMWAMLSSPVGEQSFSVHSVTLIRTCLFFLQLHLDLNSPSFFVSLPLRASL